MGEIHELFVLALSFGLPGQLLIQPPPLFLPLAIAVFGGHEGYFSLAIEAFGAFEFVIPKYYCRLGNMDEKSLDSLI